MQKHYNYLDIDLDNKNYRRLNAMQGDIKTRYILVNLYSNNLAYDLSNCTVKIYGLKRDKTIFFNNAVITNAKLGQFEIELTNQALAIAGELKIQILVLGTAGEKLTSSAFFIDVGESIIDENAIESTNEFNVFTQAMKDFQKWDGKFEEKYDGLEAEYAENITALDSQIQKIEGKQTIIGADSSSAIPSNKAWIKVLNDEGDTKKAQYNMYNEESYNPYHFETSEDVIINQVQNLADSGYRKWPGGLIIQWGTVRCEGNAGVMIHYPIEYPNQILSMQLTQVLQEEMYQTGGWVFAQKPFNSVTYIRSSEVCDVMWFTIGY